MKTIRFVCLLLFVATLAWAGASDRLVTVTPDGTMYAIEEIPGSEVSNFIESSTVLRLTIETTDGTRYGYVPESLMGGDHRNASIAYDVPSGTLFVFWVRHSTNMLGEVLVTAFHDDLWSEAQLIDAGVFRFQSNLRLAITNYASEENQRVRATGYHLVWWELDGYGERARYALLELENRQLRKIAVRDLLSFVPEDLLGETRTPIGEPALTFPAISESEARDRVEVIFGDPNRNEIYRVDIVPVASNGVLTVPIGISRPPIGLPENRVTPNGVSVGAIAAPAPAEGLLFYFREGDRLKYVRFDGETWAAEKSLSLRSSVTEDAALKALSDLLRTAGR